MPWHQVLQGLGHIAAGIVFILLLLQIVESSVEFALILFEECKPVFLTFLNFPGHSPDISVAFSFMGFLYWLVHCYFFILVVEV